MFVQLYGVRDNEANTCGRPRILGCGHSLCLNCIARTLQLARHRPEVTCPTCRRITRSATADQLPVNFELVSLMEGNAFLLLLLPPLFFMSLFLLVSVFPGS